MARLNGVKSLKTILRKKQKKYEKGVERGLKRAGLFLQRESQKIVPVDLGNLRATAFTRQKGTGVKTVVIVGYTARYAVIVHEDLEAAHGEAYNRKYAKQIAAGPGREKKTGRFIKGKKARFKARGPNQQAKFLERPLKDNRKKMAMIILKEVKPL